MECNCSSFCNFNGGLTKVRAWIITYTLMFYFNVITNPCPNAGAVLSNRCLHKITPLIFIMSNNRLVMPANDPTMRQIGAC